MTARIPVEVHAIHGTRGTKMGKKLPEQPKQRITFAEWAENPAAFNASKFVQETADYLYEVYQMPDGGSFDYTQGVKVENGKMRLLENPSPVIPTFEPDTTTQIYDPNDIPGS